MTHIFRMNFEKTFSSVSLFKCPNVSTSIFGIPATISEIFICHSGTDKLEKTEPDDYLICAVLDTHGSPAQIDDSIQKWQLETKLHPSSYFKQLFDKALGREFSCYFSSDVPGFSSHTVTEPHRSDDNQHLALISCFYYYGWLIFLRLHREQINTTVSADEADTLSSAGTIIRQRIRLINLRRYFLTQDRSSFPSLQKLCEDLKLKYNYAMRYEGLTTTHDLFEHHMDNTSKILQLKKTRAVAHTLNILTLSSIPLAIIGIALNIDLRTSIFQEPDTVFEMTTLHKIIGFSFAAPLFIIVLAKIVDWLTFNSSSSAKDEA